MSDKLIVPSVIIFGIIALLFFDHYKNHGYAYDEKDFINAGYALFKSHEGLIVTLLVVFAGILIGVSL